MNQLINLFSTLCIVVLLYSSCNDDDVATAELNEDVTLSKNETYEFYIGGYDSKSVIEIQQEPNNSKTSFIDYEQNPNRAYYRYTPLQDFTGRDEAKIYFRDVLSDADGIRLTGKHYVKINIVVE